MERLEPEGVVSAMLMRLSPIHLEVPYFSQRDSATDQGLRMCFSSTCAMAAAYLKQGCLDGNGQPDDCYLDRVQRHGDSTDAAAQIKTLRGLPAAVLAIYCRSFYWTCPSGVGPRKGGEGWTGLIRASC